MSLFLLIATPHIPSVPVHSISLPFGLLPHYTPHPAVLKLQESEPPTPRDNIRRNILAPPRADANEFPDTKTYVIEMPTAPQNQKGDLVLILLCAILLRRAKNCFLLLSRYVTSCAGLCQCCAVFVLCSRCSLIKRMAVDCSMFSHYADL